MKNFFMLALLNHQLIDLEIHNWIHVSLILIIEGNLIDFNPDAFLGVRSVHYNSFCFLPFSRRRLEIVLHIFIDDVKHTHELLQLFLDILFPEQSIAIVFGSSDVNYSFWVYQADGLILGIEL